jgi:rhodanese-related sulfurtransferase
MNLEQRQWWSKFLADSEAIIVDVRTSEEFEESRIPGAINVDIYKGQGFVYLMDEMDKSKNYYVYCLSGGRSGQACGVLKQLGFENVYNLLGGISQFEGPIE